MSGEPTAGFVLRPRGFPHSMIDRVRYRWTKWRMTRRNLDRTDDQQVAFASIDEWLRGVVNGQASIASATLDCRYATATFSLVLGDGEAMTMQFESVYEWPAVQRRPELRRDVLEAINERWGEPGFMLGAYVD